MEWNGMGTMGWDGMGTAVRFGTVRYAGSASGGFPLGVCFWSWSWLMNTKPWTRRKREGEGAGDREKDNWKGASTENFPRSGGSRLVHLCIYGEGSPSG